MKYPIRVNKSLPSRSIASSIFFTTFFLFQIISFSANAEEKHLSENLPKRFPLESEESTDSDGHKNERGFGHEEGRPGMRVGHREDGESAPNSPSQPILPEPNDVIPDAASTLKNLSDCGDGKISFQEACDDGNTSNGDGCDEYCQREEESITCGNGDIEAGEDCDDGNLNSGDGCSSECETESVCGDGVTGLGEECDDGNLTAGDGCAKDCKSEISLAFCGNGALETGEECDEGNNNGTGTCSVACKTIAQPFCGDGNTNPGEQCDGSSDCTTDCKFKDFCGNGLREGAEQCDDGNTTSGDGCSDSCLTEARDGRGTCGNRVIEVGEQCDDGNTLGGDGCSPNCQNEAVCGDRYVDAKEQCDDGNTQNGDGCSSNCQREFFLSSAPGAYCGNGITERQYIVPEVSSPEECDEGGVAKNGCTKYCQQETSLLAACVNGLYYDAEAEQELKC